MALTPHPYLQCRGLKKGRAIPLPTLRALVAYKGGPLPDLYPPHYILLHSVTDAVSVKKVTYHSLLSPCTLHNNSFCLHVGSICTYISRYCVPTQKAIFIVPHAYTKRQCQKQSVLSKQSRSTHLRSVVQLDLSNNSLSLGSSTT